MSLEMNTVMVLWRYYDRAVKLAQLSAVNTSIEQLTEIFRLNLCGFQLRYTNYQFSASRHHLNFKVAVKEKNSTERQSFETLDSFMGRGLSSLFGDVADDIQKYFYLTHKHRVKPRVTLYMVDEASKLVPIAMLPRDNESDSLKSVEEYSSFTEVKDEGIPYLSNNLAKSIKKADNYLHPELNVKKIKESYNLPNKDMKLLARIRNNWFRESCNDKSWDEMAYHPFYPDKSHLVLPITYRAHADKNKLDSGLVSILQLPDNGRSILGFIRIDHPAAFYFDNGSVNSFENIDVNAMYIYADALSLALVTYMMYTKGSSSFNEFKGKMP